MMAAPIMLKRGLHLLALLLLLWTLGLSGTGYAQTRALAEPAADAAREGEEGQVSQTYISSLSAMPVILFAKERRVRSHKHA